MRGNHNPPMSSWPKRTTGFLVCAGLVACSSVGPLEHGVEWTDLGTTAVLKCNKAPAGFCYFRLEPTNMAPAQVLRVAPGESVKVKLGSQGALYCVSESVPDRQQCNMQVLTGGFHYGSVSK